MPTIEVSDETYEKIKYQLTDTCVSLSCYDDMIGKKFFFRTGTYHQVGRVVAKFGWFVKLEDASWIGDSGRFMNAIKKGSLDEIEPVGECWVNLYFVADFFPWKHDLPKEQK